MYGVNANDLVNARMADYRRMSHQVGLENGIRHSRREAIAATASNRSRGTARLVMALAVAALSGRIA